MKKSDIKIDYKKCKNILRLDFNSISDINKLQKYKVGLIDSYRFINDFETLGRTTESLKRGFIVQVPEISKDSYIPRDKFMTLNIENAIRNIDDRLGELYNLKKLESDTYKGIYYSVIEDQDENKGGYYIEFFKDLENKYKEINFENRLDYMVIHIDDENEISNPRKYVEQHIDQLLLELENKTED